MASGTSNWERRTLGTVMLYLNSIISESTISNKLGVLNDLKRVFKDDEDPSPRKRRKQVKATGQVLQASTLSNLEDVVRMLDIDYRYMDDYFWDVLAGDEVPIKDEVPTRDEVSV